MQTTMVASVIMAICLCATLEPGCWARSMHEKTQDESNLNQGLIENALPMEPMENDDMCRDFASISECEILRGLTRCADPNTPKVYFGCDKTCGYCEPVVAGKCTVKTVDDKCCSFPFLYKGIEQNACVKGITTDRKWCGTTYNYDGEKKWGWCPDAAEQCSVKTVDDKCCEFPFLYKGIERNACVKGITTDRKWCGTSYNYDGEKKWGWCPDAAEQCSVKTVDDECCEFPFLYKGIERNACVKGITTDRKWCGTTYNYDGEKKWGWCPDAV